MYGVNKEVSVEAETFVDHAHLWEMKPYREPDHWFFRTGKCFTTIFKAFAAVVAYFE